MNIGFRERRKTILLIDSDAHARSIMRLALEAANFSVGEATSGLEGERTLSRITPDAILTDLLMETGKSGMTIAERLHARGSSIPCYIISHAAEALIGSAGLHEIGVAGVFLKPVDPPVVIQTLNERLNARPEEPSHA